MWRKFVQRYTRRFNARLQGMTPLRVTFGVTHDHHQRFLPAATDSCQSEDCVRSSRVTINRTAGSGTKGQTIGTLFNQQVIEIAFACGTAPVAVTDAAPTGIVHKITPLQVKIATFCRRGHGSMPIFHGFAQRCIGQDIERIEIDAVETDIAGNSQIFSRVCAS